LTTCHDTATMPPSPSPAPEPNPFVNRTEEPTPYEWFKMILLAPLVPIRYCDFGVYFVVNSFQLMWDLCSHRALVFFGLYYFAALVCAIVVWGVPLQDKDGNRIPLSQFRRRITRGTSSLCARGMLFALGFYWIKVKGQPDPKVRVIAAVQLGSDYMSFVRL
jgi:hypothetical protein